jgi:hypothetical protein
MKNHFEPDDDRLRALLRGAHPAPPPPPRFREAVWRRVESAEARPAAAPWPVARVEHLLLPRVALAGLALALLAGGLSLPLPHAGQ